MHLRHETRLRCFFEFSSVSEGRKRYTESIFVPHGEGGSRGPAGYSRRRRRASRQAKRQLFDACRESVQLVTVPSEVDEDGGLQRTFAVEAEGSLAGPQVAEAWRWFELTASQASAVTDSGLKLRKRGQRACQGFVNGAETGSHVQD